MLPDEEPARVAPESTLGESAAQGSGTPAEVATSRSLAPAAGAEPLGECSPVARGSWPGLGRSGGRQRSPEGASGGVEPAPSRAGIARRVLVVGAHDGGRLGALAGAEGMTVATATAEAAADSAAWVRCHVILVDAAAVGAGGEALVSRLAEAAPATPVVVAGVAPGRGPGWIDAGADDFLEDDRLDGEAVQRAIEAAVARGRARADRRRLDYAERLSAIGRLAAGVAHEVNNPAAYMLMNLRTCRDYVDELRADPAAAALAGGSEALLDEMSEMLDDNIRGIERIVSVVQALRSYSRRDPDEIESVDLADACRDAAGLVSNQIRHFAQLRLDLADGLRVAADPRRLHQVLVNLLVNARDALTGRQGGAHEISVEVVARGEWGVVRISDTGIGIAPAVRERIFEPFFTTKPRGAGSGLGLAVARDFVEQCGGQIEVDSEPGRGSTFEVLLPLELAGDTASAASTPAADRARVRLLVIDDEVALATALRRLLRHHHDVEVVNSGAEALELIARRSFDVVLCDVMMPEMDGLAVRDALIRRHPDLAGRLVFMTGGLFSEDTQRAIEALAVPVLDKPVALDDLLDEIEAARGR